MKTRQELAALELAVQRARAELLPPTTGKWQPIVRGRAAPRVTGWLELFPARGRWVTIPGVTRHIQVR